MKQLSIIVPVYKAEKYLKECLSSISKQTVKDLEIILVDDGSPDLSGEICDEFAQKDSRIRVIHQKNSGSFLARWNGLKASTGKYVCFIDADDYIEEDMMSHMLSLASEHNADMVAIGYWEEYENQSIDKRNGLDSGVYQKEKMNEIFQKGLFTGQYYQSGIIPALWNKIIRRDLFVEDYLKRNENLRMGDDAALTYPILSNCGCVIIDNEYKGYHYRILSQSISHAYDDRYFTRAMDLFAALKDNLSNCPLMQKNLNYYALFILQNGIGMLLSTSCKMSLKEKRQILQQASQQYNQIGLNNEINYELIDSNVRKILKNFVQGKIDSLLMNYFSLALKNKLLKK